MFDKTQFQSFMEQQFGITVESTEIGEEAVELYHDELMANLIPEEVLSTLPDPTLFYTFSYEEANEWFVGVAVEEVTPKS